jgi:predicted oxidoreductase
MPVIGTASPERVKATCQANVNLLSGEEWYQLLKLMLGMELP